MVEVAGLLVFFFFEAPNRAAEQGAEPWQKISELRALRLRRGGGRSWANGEGRSQLAAALRSKWLRVRVRRISEMPGLERLEVAIGEAWGVWCRISPMAV